MKKRKNTFNYICFCFLTAVCFSAQTNTASGMNAKERRQRAQKAAEVIKYPSRPWSKSFVYDSPDKRYHIRTNTSLQAASYIGQLMDYAQKKYRLLFSYNNKITPLNIFAYRTDFEYNQVIARLAPQLTGSTGMFLVNSGESAIYVPYTDTNGKSYPTKVLMHEGTHQFIHMAYNFPIPKNSRKYFSNGITRLSSVPLWLNEGLATYMENSYYDGRKLIVGEININRLKQLQYEIRKGRYVNLQKLFTTPQTKFKSSEYASAWGIIYWFLNDQKKENRRIKRRILHSYLLDCRSGFMEEPELEFRERFIKTKSTFNKLWTTHIRIYGNKYFLKRTIGSGAPAAKWHKWEEAWKKWIMKLDPQRCLRRFECK